MKEGDICPKCKDGWLIKHSETLICSHCGAEFKEVRQ